MKHKKITTLLVLIIVLTMLPLSSVLATPSQQEPTPPPPDVLEPIVGTINSIEIQGDQAAGTAIVVVTLTDADGVVHSVQLTIEAAVTLGLVIVLPDGSVEVNAAMLNTLISIDPTLIIPVVDHKVANAIADFFATLFATDAATIMGYHEEGMGFGVIAQAGFMAIVLEADGITMEDILLAKKSGDFSTLGLPEGVSVNNWGELRKEALSTVVSLDKSKNNLGAIMSGRATDTPKQHGKPAPKGNSGKKK